MSSGLRTRAGHRLGLAALAVALIAVAVAGAGTGAMEIGPGQVVGILAKSLGTTLSFPSFAFDPAQEAVFFSIRLPRVLLGALVGGALAVAGAAMQGLFRNPLADPGLLGVSNGAALAAFAVFVLGGAAAGPALLPLAAFGGALAALALLYALSQERGRVRVATMLLAGIAVNALCGAGIGLFAFLSTDAQLRGFTFWTLGSLGGASWSMLAILTPVLLSAGFLFLLSGRSLNLLALGEHEAAHLGVRIERLKIACAVLCALTVGTAVSAAGAIGFVGLVVPHILRLAGGPDHRWLLPASFLGGGSLLILADTFARTIAAPAELPVGILTALAGAPFFLWLLARTRRESAWT